MRLAPLVPKPQPNKQGRRKPTRQPTNFATRTFAVDMDSGASAIALAQPEVRSPIQAKLEVGDANDPLEREADAVADRVMRMPAPRVEQAHPVRTKGDVEADTQAEAELEADEELTEAPAVSAFAGGAALPGGREFVAQRKCASCEPEGDEIHRWPVSDLLQRACDSCTAEDELQRACASCDAEDEIQRAGASCENEPEITREPAAGRGGGATSDEFTARVRTQSRSGGVPLPHHARGFLEPRLGVDLGDLRVHTDKQAGLLAKRVNARAFTLGEDIFFAPGEWRPQTQAGMRLLTHEVAHTLQSRRTEIPGGPHPLSRIMRWKCPVPIADEATDTQRARIINCLTGMGVTKLGDLTKPISWTESKLGNTFDTLQKMRQGGGSLGTPNWVVKAWNLGRDDLKHMASILDYVALLNDMTQNSMGMDYVDAVAAMKPVIVAGVVIKKIHPRAIYFVAAAQVGMDVGGEKGASGGGHFVPVGGFQQEIVSLIKQLKIIQKGEKKVIKEGKKKRTEYHVVPGSKKAYDYIVGRVKLMDEVLAAQMNNAEIIANMNKVGAQKMIPGYNPSEHREPKLRAMFARNHELIAELKTPAESDTDARDQAGKVLAVLDGNPTRGNDKQGNDTGVAHQWGSVDPHGSDHASGIGVDIFKARGKGPDGKSRQWTNSGFKDREEIVYWVIDNYGKETGKYPRELGYEPLPSHRPNIWLTNYTPAQSRSLSLLVYNHVADIKQWRDNAKQGAKPPAELNIPPDKVKVHLQKARKAYYATRDSIYYGISPRAAAFSKHIKNTKQAEALGDVMVIAADTLHLELSQMKSSVKEIQPFDIIIRLRHIINTLDFAGYAARSYFDRLTAEAEEATTKEDLKLASDEEYSKIAVESIFGYAKRDWEQAKADSEKPTKQEQRDWKRAKRTHKSRAASIPGEFRSKRSKLGKQRRKATARRVAALAVFESTLPDVGRRNLNTLLEQLEGMLPAAAWVYEQDTYDAITSTKAGFDTWLKDVGDPERGLYDQSDIMINAMDGVLSHSDSVPGPVSGAKRHVQSGHHWEVAAQADKNETRDILLRTEDYIAMLVQDMQKRRDAGQLERVLEVMAESEGGRLLLTDGQGSGDFRRALTSVIGAEAETMLNRVRAKVIDPYTLVSGTLASNPEMALKIAMRDRGFYM